MLALNPNFYEAWYGRGFALYNLGQPTDAIASFDRTIALKPDYHPAWYDRARCYAAQGAIQPALENLKKAIDLNTANPLEYKEMVQRDSVFDTLRRNDFISTFNTIPLGF
ncbi:MAG: tetratricopeptide repeat protein [Acaryochloridaceae cyanobacterium RU_4_10]|nr:tetratricopeptide repeat protein [Acaryochloridaceae cyanobacterium RU_4_10]